MDVECVHGAEQMNVNCWCWCLYKTTCLTLEFCTSLCLPPLSTNPQRNNIKE